MLKLRDDHAAVLNTTAMVRQGVELATSNVEWVKDFYPTVIQWLKTENKPTPSSAPIPSQNVLLPLMEALLLLIFVKLF